ncbi:MAG: GNAT family protein [Saprospiraceae bacterium]
MIHWILPGQLQRSKSLSIRYLGMAYTPSDMEPINSETVILRPWQPDDRNTLVILGNNPNIARFLTDAFPSPYTEEKGDAFISMANQETPPRILAITLEDQPVGAIGLHPQTDIHCQNAEMGYWLGEPYWGRGIMTRAIRMMVSYGFTHLPVNRIFARPFHTNIGSRRALEKAGFTLEARLQGTILKHGEVLDELIYGIRR